MGAGAKEDYGGAKPPQATLGTITENCCPHLVDEGRRGRGKKETKDSSPRCWRREGCVLCVCVMGVPRNAQGGSRPGEGRGGTTQRLCEKQPQQQGWQLHAEWCGPWNLLAEVAWLPGVESEGGGAHQSQGAA